MTGFLIIIAALVLLESAATWIAIIAVCRRIGTLERGELLRDRGL